jgi:hypothetical protein
MVMQKVLFNRWRGEIKGREVLQIRDINGRIVKNVYDPDEIKRFEQWYSRCGFIERMAEAEMTEVEKEQNRKLKKWLYDQGYTYQCSLYGVWRNRDTGERIPMRVEVLSKTPFGYEEIVRIHGFFTAHPPLMKKYIIATYDKETDTISIARP